MDQQKTGAFICKLRKERGLTQRALAGQLNVTDKAVSKWERGLSYPDITILSALAESLGVTERELLTGAREQPGQTADAAPERVVKDTLEYVQKAQRQRRFRTASVFMASYTAALALAAFICALCDGLINEGFTWSPIVLAGCLLAWGAAAPFFLLKKRRLFWAGTVVTALMPLLLWTIQRADPYSGLWYPRPGLILLGLALAWAWVPLLLHTFTRMNKWYVGAVAAVLGAPMNWAINCVASGLPFPQGVPFAGALRNGALQSVSQVSSIALLLALGAFLFWMGRRRKTR